MEGITKQVAAYVAQIRYEDLPTEVVEMAKRCVLDFIGVSIKGSTLEHSKILAEYVKSIGGIPESTVIGYPFKVPAPNAGLVNGAIGHALQMDDGEMESIAHIGCEVIPATFAVGEKVGADGKSCIAAIVAGYEGAIRIGDAINPSHNKRGFSPNGTVGVFGAALAAGRILGLNTGQMMNAIGSAAMQASGLEQFVIDGSMSKFLNTGHATQAGILAALLAQRGFTGSHDILEGRKGYCRAFSDDYNFSIIVAGLGETYRILDIYFKPYPTCRWTQPAIDVTLKLAREHDIQLAEVDEVIIKTYEIAKDTTDNPHPSNATAATLSMQYSVAVAIADRQVLPEQFAPERLRDKHLQDLTERVHMVPSDDEMYNFAPKGAGAKVTIRTKRGAEYYGETQVGKGEPENPFTKEELVGKFKKLNSDILTDKRIDQIITIIEPFEELHRTQSLLDLLCFEVSKERG